MVDQEITSIHEIAHAAVGEALFRIRMHVLPTGTRDDCVLQIEQLQKEMEQQARERGYRVIQKLIPQW